MSGDGFLIPFLKVGLADVWPLRVGVETDLVVVPKENVAKFKVALTSVEKWRTKSCPYRKLYKMPQVVGVTTIVEAFKILFEDRRRKRRGEGD